MFDLEKIFNEFDVLGEFSEASELGTGHINDTYLIRSTAEPDYVLQRINHLVFRDVPALVENKILISEHLKKRLKKLPIEQLNRRVLRFVRSKSGGNYHQDRDGNYWNLTVNIHGCTTYLRVPNSKVAFEGGKLFGEFLYLTSDFEASKLTEIIPGFHKMSSRFAQFDEARGRASAERRNHAAAEISFANENHIAIQKLDNLIARGEIGLRVTHNDTKISNALFSEDDEALCVIDTDTVMPGIVHFDFGDAVRTICNTADEDEVNLAKIGFQLEYFEEFTKGFIGKLGRELSEREAESLAFSAKVMTFIVGIRMLTDFLQDDIYFKTTHEFQNLERAKSQFKLVAEIEKNMDSMKAIVLREFDATRKL